jgi:hypothetical protein
MLLLLTFWVGLVDPGTPLERGLHLDFITFPCTIQQHLYAHRVFSALLSACGCGEQHEGENEDAIHCTATGRRWRCRPCRACVLPRLASYDARAGASLGSGRAAVRVTAVTGSATRQNSSAPTLKLCPLQSTDVHVTDVCSVQLVRTHGTSTIKNVCTSTIKNSEYTTPGTTCM